MLLSLAFAATALLLRVGAGPIEKRLIQERSTHGDYPMDTVDKLEQDSLSNFAAYLDAHKSDTASQCTLDNAIIRKEWSDLSIPERQSYIKAVRCLQTSPSKSPRDKFPGALSRYDDFVATHITQALQLHSTPHLFPAHRLFIWVYEQALRNECGYEGYQPYWNWARYADDPINSPLFNGNDSSMGGNGAPSDYPGVPMGGFQKPYDMIPSAGGGGCVTEGPFKDMVVSLGPRSTIVNDVPKNPQTDGLGSNPRCLRRDVNKFAAAATTDALTYSLITENKDIDTFQQVMLGTPAKNDWGVHIGGHYTIGGDPGGDFFSSPGDPVFFFHHGMIDRIWWIWQMQDPENRMDKVAGAKAPGSVPADQDMVDLPLLDVKVPVSELMTNIGGMGGKLCYIYA